MKATESDAWRLLAGNRYSSKLATVQIVSTRGEFALRERSQICGSCSDGSTAGGRERRNLSNESGNT
jgi:hypothetical protein